ncbi:MAG: hypothetical protein AB1641_05650 [Thermodesulfobacteriota bacterium]
MAEEKALDLSALSASAQEIVNSKKAEGRWKLKDLLQVLREVAHFDELDDQLRTKAAKRAKVFLIITIVLAFLAFFTFGLTLILAIPGLIVTIVYWRKKKKYQQLDLDDEFRLVLIPFLETIAEDVAPNGRLNVKLDLDGPSEAKITKKHDIAPGRFKNVVETIYLDPWCRLEAPLAGGNSLLLSLENNYVTHERHWKNPRGKSKSKTKWKKLAVVTAGLAPNAARFDFDPNWVPPGDAQDKLKMAEKKDQPLARLTRKFKFTSVNQRPEESVTAENLVAMFFKLGYMLKTSSAGSGS